MPEKGNKFQRWCYPAFAAGMVLLAAGGLLGRGMPAPAQEQPSPTPAPTPVLQTPAPGSVSSPKPEQSAPAAICLGDTQLVVAKSREAARTLLEQVLEQRSREAEAASGGTAIQADFVEQPSVAVLSQGQPTDDGEALALLAEKLTVRVTVETETIEEIPVETQTSRDGDLMTGTRIIVSLGQTGSRRITYRTVYENGIPGEAEETASEVIREGAPLVMINGKMRLPNKDASPSRSEGEKGVKAEGITFLEPVDQRMKEYFGGLKGGYHYGVDYDTQRGETVYASAPGTVVAAFERGGYGMFVEIDHGQGFTTRYTQLADVLVEPGELVAAGDPVGVTGEEPLHFELRIQGRAYNPRYYLE